MQINPYQYESGNLCFRGLQEGPYPITAYMKSKTQLPPFLEKSKHNQIHSGRFRVEVMRNCLKHIAQGNNKGGYINQNLLTKFKVDIATSNIEQSMKAAYLAMYTIMSLDVFALIQLMYNLKKILRTGIAPIFDLVTMQNIFYLLTSIYDKDRWKETQFANYTIQTGVTPPITAARITQPTHPRGFYYGDHLIYKQSHNGGVGYQQLMLREFGSMSQYFQMPDYPLNKQGDIIHYVQSIQDQVSFDFTSFASVPNSFQIDDIISIKARNLDALLINQFWIEWFFKTIVTVINQLEIRGQLKKGVDAISQYDWAFKMMSIEENPVGTSVISRHIYRNMKFQIMLSLIIDFKKYWQSRNDNFKTPVLNEQIAKFKQLWVDKNPQPFNPLVDYLPKIKDKINYIDEIDQQQESQLLDDISNQIRDEQDRKKRIRPDNVSEVSLESLIRGRSKVRKDEESDPRPFRKKSIIKKDKQRQKGQIEKKKNIEKQVNEINLHAQLTRQIANHVLQRQKYEADMKMIQLRESQITSQNQNLQQQILSIQNQMIKLKKNEQNSQRRIQDLKTKERRAVKQRQQILSQRQKLKQQIVKLTNQSSDLQQMFYQETKKLNTHIDFVASQRQKLRLKASQAQQLATIKGNLQVQVRNLIQKNLQNNKRMQQIRNQHFFSQQSMDNKVKSMQDLLNIKQIQLESANRLIQSGQYNRQQYMQEIRISNEKTQKLIIQIQTLNYEAQELQRRVQIKDGQIKNLQNQILTLRDENNRVKTLNDQLISEKNTLEAQNQIYRRDTQNLQNKTKNLEDAYNLKAQQLQTMQNSYTRDLQLQYRQVQQVFNKKSNQERTRYQTAYATGMNDERAKYENMYNEGLGRQRNAWDAQKNRLLSSNNDKQQRITRIKDQYALIINKLMGYYFTLHRSQASRLVQIAVKLHQTGKLDKDTALFTITYCLKNYHQQMQKQQQFLDDVTQGSEMKNQINSSFRQIKNAYVFQAAKRIQGTTPQYAQRVLNGQRVYLDESPDL